MSLLVTRFLQNAQEILNVATAAAGDDCDLALVLDRQGAIRVVSDPGWQLDSLGDHYGADTVYRVRRSGSRVRIEGANGPDRCVLDAQAKCAPASPLCGILHDWPRYSVQLAIPAA
jgi:hypothetical protein